VESKLTSYSNTKLRTENIKERLTSKTRGDITIYLREINSETVYYTRRTIKRKDHLRVQGTSSSGSITSTYWPNDYYINFKRKYPYVYLCAIRLLGEPFRRETSENRRRDLSEQTAREDTTSTAQPTKSRIQRNRHSFLTYSNASRKVVAIKAVLFHSPLE
jgi:hypothetical protein